MTETQPNKTYDVQFYGCMNAFSIDYLLELKKRGYSVSYLVDCPKTALLHRPECRYSTIFYPYDDYIFELPDLQWTKRHFIVPYLMFKKLRVYIRPSKIKILSGYYVMLAPFFSRNSYCIHLSYGSDLDVVCDLKKLFRGFTWKKPWSVLWPLMTTLWMRRGSSKCQAVSYFHEGFNKAADRIIESLHGTNHIRINHYAISKDILANTKIAFKKNGGPLKIVIPTRVCYLKSGSSSPVENKGNDIMIKAFSQWKKMGKKFTVDLFEKGKDVEVLKELIDHLDCNKIIRWNKEVSFKELVNTYFAEADICFDQVGTHWVGVGIYIMGLGKPLICNARLDVFGSNWCKPYPFQNATTVDEVVEALNYFEIEEHRKMAHELGPIFVEKNLSIQPTIDALCRIIDSQKSCFI